MYAVFTEVDADDSHIEVARDFLTNVAAPAAREAGAKAGYWLAPQNGRGVSVVIYGSRRRGAWLGSSVTGGQAGDA